MTDIKIEIPGYITRAKSLIDLTLITADLLEKAEDSGLPAPRYLSVSQRGQEVCLQFGDSPDSFGAMAQWAERFGGTVTACPHSDRDGRQSVHCQARFPYLGVSVEAYAFITAATATPPEGATQ
jgi:hypothetical protein